MATLLLSSRAALTARRSRRGLPDPLLDHGLEEIRRLRVLIKVDRGEHDALTPAAFAASSVASVTSLGWLRTWCPAILPMGRGPLPTFQADLPRHVEVGVDHLHEPHSLKDNAGVRDRWFCYLLECADGTFYAGISNALDRRLAMHSQGVASKYTRTRLPVKLVYLEPQRDRASASRRELQIKKMSRARKRALTH